MSWAARFHTRRYLRSNWWLAPLAGAVGGVILQRLVVRLDQFVELPAWFAFSEAAGIQLLSSIVGGMLALVGFLFAILVLAVQFAMGQLSPRLLVYWHEARPAKLALGVLVGTLTFALSVLGRVRAGFVPSIGISVASGLMMLSLIVFVAMLHRFVHAMSPAAIASALVRAGRRAIARAYPDTYGGPRAASPAAASAAGEAIQIVPNPGQGRVLQAVDGPGLVAAAERADAVLVIAHAVGDFVGAGAPLCRVAGGRAPVPPAMTGAFALGRDRVVTHDPAFALRVLVDIANRALSPAVNDPTTAVQMLDRIGDLLGDLAGRDLDRGELRDRSGRTRVVVPSPTWQDFLALGVTEIRLYGRGAPQVMRRLRALLEELAAAAPEGRRPSVRQELERLDREVDRAFADEDDRVFGHASDGQGIGRERRLAAVDSPAPPPAAPLAPGPDPRGPRRPRGDGCSLSRPAGC